MGLQPFRPKGMSLARPASAGALGTALGAAIWQLLRGAPPPAPAAPTAAAGHLSPLLPCHLQGCPVVCAEVALSVLDAPSVGTFLTFALLLAVVTVLAFLAGLACGLWVCWLASRVGRSAVGESAGSSWKRVTPYLRSSPEGR